MPGPTALRHAFGVRLKRTITARGVRVLNQFYNSAALAQHFRHVGDGHEVEVVLGLRDMGIVSVQIGNRGYLDIPCVMPEMNGISVILWITVCKDLKRRFADEAIESEAIVLDAIQRISDIRALGVQTAATMFNIGYVDTASRRKFRTPLLLIALIIAVIAGAALGHKEAVEQYKFL